MQYQGSGVIKWIRRYTTWTCLESLDKSECTRRMVRHPELSTTIELIKRDRIHPRIYGIARKYKWQSLRFRIFADGCDPV